MKRTLTIWITLATLLLALAIPVLRTAAARPVPSEHPEYHAAIDDLRSARRHLEKALNDGYGHRDRAMRAIDNAIRECEESIRILH
jgi:transcription elongation GreA/GreB family factor